MRSRIHKRKISTTDNPLVVANGTSNNKTGIHTEMAYGGTSLEKSSNLSKKCKLESERNGDHKVLHTSEDGGNVNSSLPFPHGELDIMERDDAKGDLADANENSLDDEAEGLYEDNEKLFEKDEFDDDYDDREDD